MCQRNVEAMEDLLTQHSGLLTDVSESYRCSEGSLTQMWSFPGRGVPSTTFI
ncbi:hypothetical protein ACFWDI_02400 [Streptomyces sp. NPDC060064]|uniref:hypothetical protein n=1 Tax=Streptomyces sp. NPDC060064 TaxID=3347049 RepID=UPI00368457B3